MLDLHIFWLNDYQSFLHILKIYSDSLEYLIHNMIPQVVNCFFIQRWSWLFKSIAIVSYFFLFFHVECMLRFDKATYLLFLFDKATYLLFLFDKATYLSFLFKFVLSARLGNSHFFHWNICLGANILNLLLVLIVLFEIFCFQNF